MHGRFNDEQAVQVLKAIRASPSPVGKSLSAQVAASVQKTKPEAQDAAIHRLLRGTVTRAEMMITVKKAIGMGLGLR